MAPCLKTRPRQTGLQYRSYQLLTPEKRERERGEGERVRGHKNEIQLIEREALTPNKQSLTS